MLNTEIKICACIPAVFYYSLNQRNIKSEIACGIQYSGKSPVTQFGHAFLRREKDNCQAGRHASSIAQWHD